ncbi:uncharacterized protein B0T23DRAFT_25007 [Neurospora hispaniola]|uniref:Uncharacterized protein n=1 Tax=Neurospora hispaniola TaxID=588809 RepID=A0AAJ0MVH5_9PEZI|nr:hypothetical protein B0T23DRAFT_25007 [Neurospora hispaniola]
MRNRQMDCKGRVAKVDAGNLLVSLPCSLGLTKLQALISGHIRPFHGLAHFPLLAPYRATRDYRLIPNTNCTLTGLRVRYMLPSSAYFLHAKRDKTPRRCCAGTHRTRASSNRSPSNKLPRWHTGQERPRKPVQARGTCGRLSTVEHANKSPGQIGLAARQQTTHCGPRRYPFPLLGFLDTGSTTPAYPPPLRGPYKALAVLALSCGPLLSLPCLWIPRRLASPDWGRPDV